MAHRVSKIHYLTITATYGSVTLMLTRGYEVDVTDGGWGRENTVAAAALCSTTIKMGGGNAPRRRCVMNVHRWRAATSAHPEAPSYFHLIVHTPISQCFFFFWNTPCFIIRPVVYSAVTFSGFVSHCVWKWGRHGKCGGGRKSNSRDIDRDRRGNQEWEEEEHPHPPASSPASTLHTLTTFLWGLLINQPSISIMPPKLLFVALRGRNNQYVLWGQRAH